MTAGLLLIAGPIRAGDVSLSIAIQPPEITAGESARVEMVLTWSGGQDAFAVTGLSGPEHGGAPLTAVADDVATTQEAGQPRYRRRVTYLVRSDAPGTISLSSARVTLKAKDGATREYRSEPLGVIVRPGRGPVPTELLAGLVGLGLIGLLVRLSRRPARPPQPPGRESQARERVEALRGVGHRDHRQFFDACLDGLRDGLADLAPAIVRVRDRDRGKIVQALREAGVGPDRVQAAEELVVLCDEARFNPDPPGPAARERALNLLQNALS